MKKTDLAKLAFLLSMMTAFAFCTVYGFVFLATTQISLLGWLFNLGFTVGYFCLWLFCVWIGVWWNDNILTIDLEDAISNTRECERYEYSVFTPA